MTMRSSDNRFSLLTAHHMRKQSWRIQEAYNFCRPAKGSIFHRDQGMMHSAFKFRKLLRNLKAVQSFSNPGAPYENAVAESFFSMMKGEELSHNRHHTMEEPDHAIADFIAFLGSYHPLQKLEDFIVEPYESPYQDSHQ